MRRNLVLAGLAIVSLAVAALAVVAIVRLPQQDAGGVIHADRRPEIRKPSSQGSGASDLPAPEPGMDEVREKPKPEMDPEDLATLKQAIASRAVVLVKQDMVVDIPEIAELLIQPGQGNAINELIKDHNVAIDERISVGREVIAKLTARTGNINIEQPSGFEKRQRIHPAKATMWSWKITPKAEGVAKIRIELEHVLQVNGTEKIIPVGGFDKTIQITVKPWTQLRSWLTEINVILGLISGISAGAAGLFAYAAFWKRRNRRPHEDAT